MERVYIVICGRKQSVIALIKNAESQLNPVNPEVVASNFSSSSVDPTADLVVIVHGFTGSVTSKSVTLIRDALLHTENITVIAVQWAHLARGPWYDEAVGNTLAVARHLSHFLLHLEQSGYDMDRVHLIGFSLGAHVAGFTGALLEGRLGRITGLDPARPGFDTGNSKQRLDPTDAKFVMGLHTSAGFVALSEPVGHVDFYPNGGSRQPHCETKDVPLVCNHYMAYVYFAESIYHSEAFPSRSCSSWSNFSSGLCDTNDVAPMGYFTTNLTRGLYFLQTNAQQPYGLGQVDHRVSDSINQTLSSSAVSPVHTVEKDNVNSSTSSCGHHRDVYCVDNRLDDSGGVDVHSLDDLHHKPNAYSQSSKSSVNAKYVSLLLCFSFYLYV